MLLIHWRFHSVHNARILFQLVVAIFIIATSIETLRLKLDCTRDCSRCSLMKMEIRLKLRKVFIEFGQFAYERESWQFCFRSSSLHCAPIFARRHHHNRSPLQLVPIFAAAALQRRFHLLTQPTVRMTSRKSGCKIVIWCGDFRSELPHSFICSLHMSASDCEWNQIDFLISKTKLSTLIEEPINSQIHGAPVLCATGFLFSWIYSRWRLPFSVVRSSQTRPAAECCSSAFSSFHFAIPFEFSLRSSGCNLFPSKEDFAPASAVPPKTHFALFAIHGFRWSCSPGSRRRREQWGQKKSSRYLRSSLSPCVPLNKRQRKWKESDVFSSSRWWCAQQRFILKGL